MIDLVPWVQVREWTQGKRMACRVTYRDVADIGAGEVGIIVMDPMRAAALASRIKARRARVS
jgi:hypothetical protein